MSFRKANNILLIAVIAVNLYVIAVPFMPQLLFLVEQGRGRQQALEESLRKPHAPTQGQPTGSDSSSGAPQSSQPNRVIIPAMMLEQPIVEGTNMYRSLDKGIWRWPGGSTPDKGGNTVLVGHRFTYTQPRGVFYFLDKLHPNDSIGIVWGDKTYVYRVTETKVVPPTQTSILNPTDQPTLTMYTCTPLWLPKDRLVITASLETTL